MSATPFLIKSNSSTLDHYLTWWKVIMQHARLGLFGIAPAIAFYKRYGRYFISRGLYASLCIFHNKKYKVCFKIWTPCISSYFPRKLAKRFLPLDPHEIRSPPHPILPSLSLKHNVSVIQYGTLLIFHSPKILSHYWDHVDIFFMVPLFSAVFLNYSPCITKHKHIIIDKVTMVIN